MDSCFESFLATLGGDGIATRIRNGLHNDGIDNLEKLRSRSPAQFMWMPNFGKVSVDRLVKALAALPPCQSSMTDSEFIWRDAS